jgi:hypothetical protein
LDLAAAAFSARADSFCLLSRFFDLGDRSPMRLSPFAAEDRSSLGKGQERKVACRLVRRQGGTPKSESVRCTMATRDIRSTVSLIAAPQRDSSGGGLVLSRVLGADSVRRTRMREELARYAKWVSRQRGRVRDLFRLIRAKRARDREDSRQSAARSRFWTDLREGQREADAQCARREP